MLINLDKFDGSSFAFDVMFLAVLAPATPRNICVVIDYKISSQRDFWNNHTQHDYILSIVILIISHTFT